MCAQKESVWQIRCMAYDAVQHVGDALHMQPNDVFRFFFFLLSFRRSTLHTLSCVIHDDFISRQNLMWTVVSPQLHEFRCICSVIHERCFNYAMYMSVSWDVVKWNFFHQTFFFIPLFTAHSFSHNICRHSTRNNNARARGRSWKKNRLNLH